MKKIILFLFALIAGAHIKTYATHDIGGSLTYQCVAPNTYVVTYSHYNWAGLSSLTSFSNLDIKAPGCNVGRSIPLQYQTEWVEGILPTFTGPFPYKISTLTATVTFTAAEAACKDWVLSVSTGMLGQTGANFTPSKNMISVYTEATLKLDVSLNNNSPVFDAANEPVLLAAKYQPIVLSVGASDPDGDSLAYRMVAPLEWHNQPLSNYVGFASQIFVNPTPQAPYSNPGNPQYTVIVGGGLNYTPDYPLLSYTANWSSGQPLCPGTRYFTLDTQNGGVAFTPMAYDSVYVMNNTYLASFQVDEYRKVNGVMTKIGSVRRETVIIVGDPSTNINPRLSNLRVNNAPVQQTAGFTVKAGSTINLKFDGADVNTTDSVFLASNAATALPGATFTVNSASRQTGTITWTPTAAEVRSQPYYLRIWVKDNAKPFAGKHVETIAVRVSNTGGVTGLKKEASDAGFIAYPNPFTDAVNFKLNLRNATQSIVIYNALGQEVDRISLSGKGTGEQSIRWENASSFAAGTYVARLVGEEQAVQTLKFSKIQ